MNKMHSTSTDLDDKEKTVWKCFEIFAANKNREVGFLTWLTTSHQWWCHSLNHRPFAMRQATNPHSSVYLRLCLWALTMHVVHVVWTEINSEMVVKCVSVQRSFFILKWRSEMNTVPSWSILLYVQWCKTHSHLHHYQYNGKTILLKMFAMIISNRFPIQSI